jgi:hypothetical protein
LQGKIRLGRGALFELISFHPSVGFEFPRNPILKDQFTHGVHEDFQIGTEGAVPNILELQGKLGRPDEFLVCFLRVAAAFEYGRFIGIPNRCPVCNSWKHREDLPFLGRILVHIFLNFRPRSHKTHFPLDYIQ